MMAHWNVFHVLLFTSAVFNRAFSTTDWHFSGQNVAHLKHAFQTPTYHGTGKAALAVDGNVDSCTFTSGRHDTLSWTVQLETPCRISGIIIYNTEDATLRNRLRGFSVHGNGGSLIYDDARIQQYKKLIIQIPVNNVQLYSSITIQIPRHSGKSYLTLCEVRVFEVPTAACKTLSQRDLINVNAHIVRNTGIIDHGKNTVGTIIAFSCSKDYRMEGSAFIECLPIGKYNTSIPRCVATCHRPVIPAHGTLVPLKTEYVAGEEVKLKCAERYSLSKNSSTRCTESHIWCGTLPTCNRIQCPYPGTPQDGYYTTRQNSVIEIHNYKPMPFQSVIIHFCKTGFNGGGDNISRDCQSDGTWSGREPKCNRIKCLYPGTPQNGYYTTRQNSVIKMINYKPMPFESVIIHFCNTGYDGGDNITRVCQSDGTWRGREPKCYPITCTSPTIIEHGSYHFQNNTRYIAGTVSFNTSLYIFCETGYFLYGYHQIVCASRNSWHNLEAACKVVTCKYPGSFPHGFYAVDSLQPGGYVKPKPLTTEDILEYSMQIFVQCTPGNILKSPNTSRVCLESGHWSGGTPLCVHVKCKWPLQLNGGRYIPSNILSASGLSYNTTLEAVCDPTFKLSRNYQSRRCNEMGDWDYVPAVCEPLCQLQNLTNVFIPRESPTFYEVGSTVHVSCKNGFTLSPDENITCEDNHQWSGTPECLAVSKPEKQESNNRAVIGGVTATILLVLLVVFVLVVFLHRRRQQMLHTKVQSPLSHADITSRHAKHDSERPSMTFSNSAFAAEQSHTYSNTLPLRPVIPSVESSVSLQSEREYYSFTCVNKIPKTAIRVEDLSDFVFSSGHSKEGFKNQFKSLPQGMSGPHSEAIKPQNRGKNRYKNLYAYDDTRVVLEIENESQSDYINACYVHGFRKTRKYIAVQGPTKEILDDFWKMIWQEDCHKIVMLTKLVEEGKTKCERYWPDEGSFTYGRVTVTMKSTESFSQFSIRTFTIEKDNLHSKTVTQFHFTAWPDKDVPKYASSLVQFLAKVKSNQSEGTGPTVVHCSAGVGRTGTFIALDNLTEQGNELGYVDVAGMVASLRRQRVSMVQTLEQYIFVHHALVESLMLSTSALPAGKFPEAFKELLQVDNTKKKTKISIEFETLKSLSPLADEYQYISSKQMRNRQKNRYSNVPPVEEFMPALTSADRPKEANYINAVFLPSYKEQKAFIITQAPLKATKEDFWRLVWEHDVHTIVMMNNMLEIKASEVYWPCENERATFGNIIVMNDGSEEINKHHVLSLTIKKHAVTRYIKIFQCVGWQPHESLPASPEVILSLMEIVQVWQQQTGNHTIVVHCLNGADKSGLFCVISAVIERMKIEQDVAISQVIEEMRNAREQIIPSVEQYQFCHESVLAFMNQYDTYSNFSSY